MRRIKNNIKYEVLTPDGWSDFDGILVTPDREIIEVEINGNKLKCTKDHMVEVDGKFIEAKDHESARDLHRKETVYDLLNVQKGNRYYTNGIVSHNCLYVDEFAFVARNIAEEFWTSVYPVLSTGGKCIITSTPKGDNNRFYYIWRDSYILKSESDEVTFAPLRIYWQQHPDRDEEWARRTMKALGSKEKWEQEYECSFLSNAQTLIGLDVLDKMKREVIEKKAPPKGFQSGWDIFLHPKSNRDYYMTVDVSEGIGGDYHAITIFNDLLEQVAIFHSNDIDHEALAKEIKRGSDYYNECPILLELNGPGMAVIPLLERVQEIGDRIVKEGKRKGIRMTYVRRNQGITILRQLLSNQRMKLNSTKTIDELRVFKRRDGRSKFEAEFGCHDDLVMNLVLFASELDRLANNSDSLYTALYEQNDELITQDEQESYEPVPPMIGGHINTNNEFDWL